MPTFVLKTRNKDSRAGVRRVMSTGPPRREKASGYKPRLEVAEAFTIRIDPRMCILFFYTISFIMSSFSDRGSEDALWSGEGLLRESSG